MPPLRQHTLSRALSFPSPPRTIPSDILDFLNSYPSRSPPQSLPSHSANLTFYQNLSPARPSKLGITALHASLRGNYAELEGNHAFIQWLFPIREMGMNWASQPLEPHEIIALREDEAAMLRLQASYELLLDFYGMVLVDFSTGQVKRKESPLAPDQASWKRRYGNLSTSFHNYLRVTRMLKCFSELGVEHLNAAWLLFFLVEQARGELDAEPLVRSMDGYWRWCIRNEEEREWVARKIAEVREGGAWTEEDYQEALARRKRTGRFEEGRERDSGGPSAGSGA